MRGRNVRRPLSPSPQPSPLKGEGVSDQKFLLQCTRRMLCKIALRARLAEQARQALFYNVLETFSCLRHDLPPLAGRAPPSGPSPSGRGQAEVSDTIK